MPAGWYTSLVKNEHMLKTNESRNCVCKTMYTYHIAIRGALLLTRAITLGMFFRLLPKVNEITHTVSSISCQTKLNDLRVIVYHFI